MKPWEVIQERIRINKTISMPMLQPMHQEQQQHHQQQQQHLQPPQQQQQPQQTSCSQCSHCSHTQKEHTPTAPTHPTQTTTKQAKPQTTTVDQQNCIIVPVMPVITQQGVSMTAIPMGAGSRLPDLVSSLTPPKPKVKRKAGGQKEYVCPHCSRGFSRRGNLIRHIRLHFGVKPYQCGQCQKKFSTKSNLQTHERVHTKPPLVTCEYCGREFRRPTFLRRHEAKHMQDGDRKREVFIDQAQRQKEKFDERRKQIPKEKKPEPVIMNVELLPQGQGQLQLVTNGSTMALVPTKSTQLHQQHTRRQQEPQHQATQQQLQKCFTDTSTSSEEEDDSEERRFPDVRQVRTVKRPETLSFPMITLQNLQNIQSLQNLQNLQTISPRSLKLSAPMVSQLTAASNQNTELNWLQTLPRSSGEYTTLPGNVQQRAVANGDTHVATTKDVTWYLQQPDPVPFASGSDLRAI